MDGVSFALVDADADEQMQGRIGETMSVAELLERMIVISSNEAADMLIDRLGFEALNADLVAVGAVDSRLRHHFGDRAAWGTAERNVNSAADLARMAAAIAAGRAAASDSCERMLDLVRRQHERDLIPATLPATTSCGNKPGVADGVLHDVAIIKPPGIPMYAEAICTVGYADREAAAAAIRGQARLIGQSVVSGRTVAR